MLWLVVTRLCYAERSFRADLESWAGCIAGALEEDTYRQLLQAAGFQNIESLTSFLFLRYYIIN